MKRFYPIFIAIIITACSNSHVFDNEFKPGEKQKDLYEKYSGTETFTDIFDLKETISLEFKEEAALSSIQRIFFCNNKYYIFSAFPSSIKCFSADGKYAFSIGKKGEGPGEYLQAYSMDIQGDRLFVLDGQMNKVITYNLDSGQYIKEVKLNYHYMKILTQGNVIYLYKDIAQNHVYKNSAIDLYDENCKFLTSIELKSPDKPEKFVFLPGLNFGFAKNNKDRIYYVNQCDLLLRCVDTKVNEVTFGANELPKGVKLSDPPKVSSFENMNKFGEVNSILYGFFYFYNGLIVEHLDRFLALYDSNGNLINKIDIDRNLFYSDFEYLYSWQMPGKTDKNSNGKLLKYELKK